MKNIHLVFLSLLSGLLLSLAWPMNGIPLLLFLGFIPLLFIEDHILNNKKDYSNVSVLLYSYPGFILWNVLTSYWLTYSTLLGVTLVTFFNSLFMSIVFLIYHLIRRKLPNQKHGYFVLVFLWITFEYFHLKWAVSWPWLNLGNGFMFWNKWIQWYEFTGTFGGSIWVLSINILLFKAFNHFRKNEKRPFKANLMASFLLLIIPILSSFYLYYNYEENEKPIDVIVVQPNNDPYTEQFELSPKEVLTKIFNLSEQIIDNQVELMILPESAFQENPLWESQLLYTESFKLLAEYYKNHPNLSTVVGATTYNMFEEGEEVSLTARKLPGTEDWFEAYNTAALMNHSSELQLYHKSKLTPGVEKMPFSELFRNIEKYAIDLGGTTGSLGIDTERKVFITPSEDRIGPVICYESVYGEFVGGFVRKGAQTLCIITNDGWWHNSPGHRQHLGFASLRAIETRRSIARSANTGISAFINQRGDIQQATEYGQSAVIRQNINLNDELTIYTKYGDYLGRTSLLASILLVLISISQGLKNRGKLTP